MGQSILFDTISSLCTENPHLNVLDSNTTIMLNKNNISLLNSKYFLYIIPFIQLKKQLKASQNIVNF